MPEVGCNNAMFFLQVFGHFDFLLQVLGQKADPGGSVWVRYLKPWNWDGKQAWKWEDAASYLIEYCSRRAVQASSSYGPLLSSRTRPASDWLVRGGMV